MKFNENSERVLRKLHKEGLLGNFVKSIEKSIRGKTEKDIDKILKRGNKEHERLLKKIKKDPEQALKDLIKDLS